MRNITQQTGTAFCQLKNLQMTEKLAAKGGILRHGDRESA